MSNLVPFSFESHEIRTLADDKGSPWFVLRDVLGALGTTTPTTVAVESITTGLGDGFNSVIPIADSLGREQATIIIAESAVTYLLSRSDTEQGRRLNRFIHVEVLPAIRKTGHYEAPAATPKGDDPRIAALKLSSLAMQAARAFGFKGNHAALSADQAIKTLTGTSPLALLGHAHLVADARGQTYGLNELGQMLDPPISGVVLGKKLAEAGLRAKDEVGNWVPTDAASGLFEWMDTAKRHNGGTPVKQVKWFRDVLTRVQ